MVKTLEAVRLNGLSIVQSFYKGVFKMSNKVNGLWAVNSSSVFMFFNSVGNPSVWRFRMDDGVESWRMIPGVNNAQAVRGVAAAYRADGGTWLDPHGADYAQAVSEIGDLPLIVERGDCTLSPDCGDYSAGGVSLSDVDREHGWELSWENGGMVVSRDVSFLTPAELDHPEMCETYDDLPVVSPEEVEPEPETVEIPEVPPTPSEDTPKVTVQHGVKARVLTIPGGKSVKELSDVFGAFAHKPRGFRDSKGRRVAYVAFDKTGGVVAYRDCYQRGTDQALEESVAAYLAQHEIVEVA